jgi:excisionase family DNA binding protein
MLLREITLICTIIRAIIRYDRLDGARGRRSMGWLLTTILVKRVHGGVGHRNIHATVSGLSFWEQDMVEAILAAWEAGMEELLTVKEAAARLKVSARTIKNWLYSGALHGVKAGRAWRITPSAIARFLHESPRKPLAVKEDAALDGLNEAMEKRPWRGELWPLVEALNAQLNQPPPILAR